MVELGTIKASFAHQQLPRPVRDCLGPRHEKASEDRPDRAGINSYGGQDKGGILAKLGIGQV